MGLKAKEFHRGIRDGQRDHVNALANGSRTDLIVIAHDHSAVRSQKRQKAERIALTTLIYDNYVKLWAVRWQEVRTKDPYQDRATSRLWRRPRPCR
jgi:hypothetical protein